MYPLTILKSHLDTLVLDDKCIYIRDMIAELEKLSDSLHLEQALQKFPLDSRVYMDNSCSLFTGKVNGHTSSGRVKVRWDDWKRSENYGIDDIKLMPENPADLLDVYYPVGTKIGYKWYGHPDQKAVVKGWDVDGCGVWIDIEWEGGKQERVRTDRFSVSWLSSRIGCYQHSKNYWDDKDKAPFRI